MKKQVCRNCKAFCDDNGCPYCKKKNFASAWQGKITFISPDKSVIAKKMGIEKEGEFAIKVR